jgi:hypothetical protein
VSAALREIPAPSMIIGGFAVIAGGFARYTHDVDAVIRGRDSDVASVLAAFARHGIGFRHPDARGAVAEKQVLFLRQRDVAQLLLLHLDDIDVARVRGLLAEIAEVLGDPERLAEFDNLVERARRARR